MGWFTKPQFAFCRGIASHAWHYPPELSHEGKRLLLSLTCDHCGAKRRDHIAPASGAVESRSYSYAEGYQFHLNGSERPAKEALRKDGIALLWDTARGAKVRRLRPRNGRAA